MFHVKRFRIRSILPLVAMALMFTAGCLPIPTPEGWSAPALVDGDAFVASREGRIVRVDPDSGREDSIFPRGDTEPVGEVYGDLIVRDRTLYVSSFRGTYRSIVIASGAVASQIDVVDPIVGDGVIVGDDLLFTTAGADKGRVFRVSLSNLSDVKWETELSDAPIWSAVVVDGETGYISSLDRKVYSINLSNGVVGWTFEAGAGVGATPVVSGGTVYVGAFDRIFYAIDARTGDERWRFSGADGFYWGRAAVGSGRVFVATLNGAVYALNTQSGAPAWSQPFQAGSNIVSDLLLTEDQVVFGTDDGRVIALARSSGQPRWIGELATTEDERAGLRVRAIPQLLDGVYYVTAMKDGKVWLYTLDAATGRRTSAHQVSVN